MNDTYLKMCLALPPEVLEGWDWNRGDRALYSDGSLNFKPDPLSVIVLGDNNHKSFLFKDSKLGYYKRGDFYEVDRIITPIPSQEQLLQIHKEKHDTATESHSMLFFANWLEDKVKEDHGFCLYNETAEEMMLMWIMETCFDKKLVNGAWI